MSQQSVFGIEEEFERAFAQLTSEPPSSTSTRFELDEERMEHLRDMCKELDSDRPWEEVAFECVRRVYVGEG